MELSLGTEVRDEYLSWELGASARRLVEDVMLTKPGENLVITADYGMRHEGCPCYGRSRLCGRSHSHRCSLPPSENGRDGASAPVAGAIRHADVWIEYAVAYLLHTQAYKEALKNGARYICLTGMDAMMMVNTIGRVKYDKVLSLGKTPLRDRAKSE